MVIIRTSTEEVSIQAVSPVSIFGAGGVAAAAGAAAGAASGAAAGAAAAAAGAAEVVLLASWAMAEPAIAPPARVAARANAASRLSVNVIGFPLVPMVRVT